VFVKHFSALRIYGDRASDMVDGLMKRPSVAVPLVLRRLRAKLDEWREAQKNYNRLWRDQCDKNHAKWLQSQAAAFRQLDGRQMRTKTLLNEADTAAEEVCSYRAGSWSLRHGMIDCGVRGRGQLCLSRQPLRCTALGTGCAPFLH